MILQRLKAALGPKLRKFLNKDYRDGYLQTHVRSGIALQIRALREKAGLSQEEFATHTGKQQSTISRLESTDYGRVSVNTLLEIASAMNVALLVRFVDYPQFLRVASDMSPDALAPNNIYESLARSEGETSSPIMVAQIDWDMSSADQAAQFMFGAPQPATNAQLVPLTQ